MKRLILGLFFFVAPVVSHAISWPKVAKSFVAQRSAAAGIRYSADALHNSSNSEGSHKNYLSDLNVVKPLIITPDPKPNFSSVISGKSQRDINTYYSLRENAFIGDGSAMLKMSDLTRSGKINDPGEPYYGYWLFQALRSTQVSANSTRMAKTKAQEVCRNEVDRRRSNRLFDTACSSLDGINYFADAVGSSALIEQFQKKQTMQEIEK